MKAENRIRLERLTGQVEGLSFCIENKEISEVLLDIAEAIDCVIVPPCKVGDRVYRPSDCLGEVK